MFQGERVTAAGTSRRIALVFPGQGSQRPDMLSRLPEVPGLDRLLDGAEALTDADLRAVSALGTAEDLADTRVAQPLLYLADWAWGRALLDAGIRPALVAGHSLGELAALAVAGVFSVEAGLQLVVERSRLMAVEAATAQGSMAAVLGLSADAIAQAIEGIDGAWVANDNSPGQIVVSGTKPALAAATGALSDAGAKRVVMLDVSGAFHSPLMSGAATAFAALLEEASFADADIPVVQNCAPGEPTKSGEAIRANLSRQITSPVRWTETMQTFIDRDIDLVVESGPGSVLCGLAKRVDGLTCLSAEESGVAGVLQEVST